MEGISGLYLAQLVPLITKHPRLQHLPALLAQLESFAMSGDRQPRLETAIQALYASLEQ
jgi:hypothetical protein